MIRAITISTFLLIAGTAGANEAKENCASFSESAEMVMEARQNGLPMREAMAMSDMALWNALVQDAYDTPQYQTESVQQRVIRQFGNEVYAMCYESMSDG